MTPERLPRRGLLAAAVGLGLLGGCGSPPRAVRRPPLALRVFAPSLYPVRDALLGAWQRDGAPFPPNIVAGEAASFPAQPLRSGQLPLPGVDAVEAAPGAGTVDLTPYLHRANFDPGSLVPEALPPSARVCGKIVWMPLRLTEIQFYANDRLLRALHALPAGPWTLAHLVAALQAHAAAASLRAAPAVLGLGWGDLRLWGAFVVGLGGGFTRQGRLDLGAAAAATATLAGIGRRCGWSAGDSGDALLLEFERRGFSGARTGGSLFALLPPGVPVGGTAARAFPVLPRRAAVPAWQGTALFVQPHYAAPGHLVRFGLWLYQPAQQRLLAGAGVPPLLRDQGLRAFWHGLQGTRSGALERFSFSGYTDVAELLRQALRSPALDLPGRPAALARIGAGGSAGPALAAWQQELQARAARQGPLGCALVGTTTGGGG